MCCAVPAQRPERPSADAAQRTHASSLLRPLLRSLRTDAQGPSQARGRASRRHARPPPCPLAASRTKLRAKARAPPPRRPAAAHVSWSGTVARHLARASHLAPLDLGVVSHCCTGRARSVCCPWPCARADRPDCRANQTAPRAVELQAAAAARWDTGRRARARTCAVLCAFAALRARWIVAGVHVHVHVPGCDFLAILLFCVDCGTGEGWAVHSARSCAWSTRRLFTVESN